MKRFRLNTLLIMSGAMAGSSLATFLFMKGYWPQATLVLIIVAACLAALVNIQSRLIGIMSAFLKALEMNDTTMRIQAGGDRELREMTESMNRIAEIYRDNMRELQTRKLYYDRVLRIMTHEMRNGITPIAAITADMCNHPERYQGEKLTEASTLLNSQAEGIHRFLDSYHRLTHLPEPKLENVYAGDYFQSLKKIYNAELERRGLPEETVFYTVAHDMILTIDSQLMNQVMINLLRNALDATPEDRVCKVDVVLSASESRPYITIKDNGCGITQGIMDNMFQPFFTTKKEGSGVGLSISRQIIQKHGGDIRIQSQPEKGTLVIISL